jgi:hypothetical protein
MAVKPSDIAANITPLPQAVGQQAEAVNLLQDRAQIPASTPLAASNVRDMKVSKDAASLYVDPTPAFRPVLEGIDRQRVQANERYAQNKADIANIFGNLTQVNQESQARVRQQFEQSITNQQMSTAQRMAQARMGAEQTQQAALQAMNERGGGPMGNLMASPAAVASERAIGDIGSYAQIWEGQQRAIQEQTQQDLQAGLRGLGFQQAQSVSQLQRSLQDTLNMLSGQETGVRSQLAEAIIGARGQVAQANYNEVLAKRAAEEARRLAAIRGAYDVQQAQIDAQNKLELAKLEAQTRVIDYPQTSAGVTQFMRNNGASPQDIANFWGGIDSTSISGVKNSQEAYAAWLEANTSTGPKGRKLKPSAGEQAAARLYFDGLRYNTQQEGDLIPRVNLPSNNTMAPGTTWNPYGTR